MFFRIGTVNMLKPLKVIWHFFMYYDRWFYFVKGAMRITFPAIDILFIHLVIGMGSSGKDRRQREETTISPENCCSKNHLQARLPSGRNRNASILQRNSFRRVSFRKIWSRGKMISIKYIFMYIYKCFSK